MKKQTVIRGSACTSALLLACLTTGTSAQSVLMSDNFSRAVAGTPVGSPPSRDATAAAQAAAATNWVSSWGANNNYAGGTLAQTYTTYLGNDGASVQRNFKVDGSNGISGNWLNNGSSAHPLKSTGSTATLTEPIGITGFAWTQINHDFASNPTVQAAQKIRINFDLYRTASGNQSWFFGQSDPTGVANGNAGSPATVGSNDISLYFRGVQANTFGLRDNGTLPTPVTGIASYDTISYAAGTTLFPQPIPIQIEISGTNFISGQSTLDLWVGGTQQDLNGSDNPGTGYNFAWDGGAAAYMGFASNSTPVEGTAAAPVYRAQGIDNLVISTFAPVAPAWAADVSGNWNDASSWSTNVVPNGATITATLGNVVTTARTVTLASAVNLSKLTVNSGAGSYIIDSPSASRLSVGTLEISGGRLDLDDSGNTDSVTVTNVLTVASGAQLNLRNGALMVNYTGASPLASIAADILAGKITGDSNRVAAVEATELGLPTFRGVPVTSSSILMIRTYAGDTNLDQSVNFDDLLALAQSYNATSNVSWAKGDFDYNGAVNFDDLLALAQNYNLSLAVTGSFESDWALARSLAPEPMSLMGFGVTIFLVRRRRSMN